MDKTHLLYSTFAIVASGEKKVNLDSGCFRGCRGGEEAVFGKSLPMDEKERILYDIRSFTNSVAFKESEVGNDELSSPARRRMAGG